jgi:hypothetical protein
MIGPAAVAPDGTQVVGIKTDDRSSWLIPLEPGNQPSLIPGLDASDIAVQ